MKKIKLLMAILIIVVMGLTTGCAQIFSDITINSDLSGTWKSKIFAIDPSLLKKEDLEKEFKKNGIQNYTINPTKGKIEINGNGDKQDSDGWEVIAPFKDQAELKKIRTLLAMADPIHQNQRMPEPFTRVDRENENLVTVNLGHSGDETIIHIDGTFVKESITGEITDNKTVKFTKGQPVTFKFIPTKTFMGMDTNKVIVGGGIVLVIGSYIFYRRRSGRKDKVA